MPVSEAAGTRPSTLSKRSPLQLFSSDFLRIFLKYLVEKHLQATDCICLFNRRALLLYIILLKQVIGYLGLLWRWFDSLHKKSSY